MEQVKKYRKKPVIISAIQWIGDNSDEIKAFCGDSCKFAIDNTDKSVFIYTLEGVHKALPGDFIIRGVQGEYYPCKPDIFAMTYDEEPKDV